VSWSGLSFRCSGVLHKPVLYVFHTNLFGVTAVTQYLGPLISRGVSLSVNFMEVLFTSLEWKVWGMCGVLVCSFVDFASSESRALYSFVLWLSIYLLSSVGSVAIVSPSS
jgi:hypothetical protein